MTNSRGVREQANTHYSEPQWDNEVCQVIYSIYLAEAKERFCFLSVTLREFSLCCSHIKLVGAVDFICHALLWHLAKVKELLHVVSLNAFVATLINNKQEYSANMSHLGARPSCNTVQCTPTTSICTDFIPNVTLLWAGASLSWAMDWLSFICC